MVQIISFSTTSAVNRTKVSFWKDDKDSTTELQRLIIYIKFTN